MKKKSKRTKMRKKYNPWVEVWHELKSAEGGRGTALVGELKSYGIPAQSGPSPYVGHICIYTHESDAKKAERICSR